MDDIPGHSICAVACTLTCEPFLKESSLCGVVSRDLKVSVWLRSWCCLWHRSSWCATGSKQNLYVSSYIALSIRLDYAPTSDDSLPYSPYSVIGMLAWSVGPSICENHSPTIFEQVTKPFAPCDSRRRIEPMLCLGSPNPLDLFRRLGLGTVSHCGRAARRAAPISGVFPRFWCAPRSHSDKCWRNLWNAPDTWKCV